MQFQFFVISFGKLCSLACLHVCMCRMLLRSPGESGNRDRKPLRPSLLLQNRLTKQHIAEPDNSPTITP